MGKSFWVRLGIKLFIKWLDKKDHKNNMLFQLLAQTNDVEGVKAVLKEKVFADSVSFIVTEIAEEPSSNIFDAAFSVLGGK